MNFNFESPYIEYDSENFPYSLYEIHGLNKIRELSRQLRTFINYKTATMKYRFRPKIITSLIGVDSKYNEIKRKLKQNSTIFIKLLHKIKGDGISYKVELVKLQERIKFSRNKFSRDILTDLRDVTQKLFLTIHELSEHELHLHPEFLKFTVNLSQEACTVFKILNNWASGFYEELSVNYRQLYDELGFLIPEEGVEKSTVKEQKSLEEGIKDW